MRHLILFILSTLFLFSCSRSTSDRFIDNYKDKSDAICMTIPGWLIHTGAKFADEFSNEEDEKVFRQIAEHIDGVRFMVLSDNKVITPAITTGLLHDLKNKDGLEEYVVAKDGKNRINILMLDKDAVVKNLTIIVQADDSFVLAKIDTDLPLEILKEANFSFNKPSNQVVD